jgi:predicted  nucleic acid-binding Zn-ribbon protein
MMEEKVACVHVRTTRLCKDCGNFYRIDSFSKDSGCPKCSSHNTESAHKDFMQKSKEEQDRIMDIIMRLQREDMIKASNKQRSAG